MHLNRFRQGKIIFTRRWCLINFLYFEGKALCELLEYLDFLLYLCLEMCLMFTNSRPPPEHISPTVRNRVKFVPWEERDFSLKTERLTIVRPYQICWIVQSSPSTITSNHTEGIVTDFNLITGRHKSTFGLSVSNTCIEICKREQKYLLVSIEALKLFKSNLSLTNISVFSEKDLKIFKLTTWHLPWFHLAHT